MKRNKERFAVKMAQKYMRGYLAQKRCLKLLLELRSTQLHDYWSKIDKIARGHFQRRVRRAWLKYKENKKKKQEMKLEKAKTFRRRGTVAIPALKKQMTTNFSP